MLENYFPILVFIIMGVIFGVMPIILGSIIGPRRPGEEKQSQYECGFAAFDDSRMKFDVRFYLIAILFIIFDLEIALLFPWAVAIKTVGLPGMIAAFIFLGLLTVGFVYEWKKGALEWE